MINQDKKIVDGTNIELYDQAPWSRTTVADGKWLQQNTLDPISANDRILASAINDVSATLQDEIDYLGDELYNTSSYLEEEITKINARADVIDVVGNHEAFEERSAHLVPGVDISDRDVIKVLNDDGDDIPAWVLDNGSYVLSSIDTNNQQSYYRWLSAVDGNTSGWEYVGSLEPYYKDIELSENTITFENTAPERNYSIKADTNRYIQITPYNHDASIGLSDDFINSANLAFEAYDALSSISGINDGSITGPRVNHLVSNFSLAQGSANSASYYSFSQGLNNSAENDSLAQGANNKANNRGQALGYANSANNDGFAAGQNNSAENNSFAQGSENNADINSFAQGTNCSAKNQAFAQGNKVSAENYSIGIGKDIKVTNNSLAIGYHSYYVDGKILNVDNCSVSIGKNASAGDRTCLIGENNSCKDRLSFAQGSTNYVREESFAQGVSNSADYRSLAQGYSASAYTDSLAQGSLVTAKNESLAQGGLVIAKNESLAQGSNITANDDSLAQGEYISADERSMAQGYNTSAYHNSFAQGYSAHAYDDSFAQGDYVSAKTVAFAQGRDASAYYNSFAQGSQVKADYYSISQGLSTSANNYSIAQGYNNSAFDFSQAFGNGTKLIHSGMAIGTYNSADNVPFVIGNGRDDDHRSDLFLINENGDTTSIGAAYFTGFSGTNISGLTQTASIDGLINSAANGGSMTGLKNASGLEFQYQDGSTPTAITAALQTSADKLIFVPSSGCADWLKFATDGYDSTDNSQIIKILTPNFQSQIEALDTKKLDVSSLNLRITGTAPTLTSAYVGINSIPFQAKYDDMGNVINETYLMEHKFTAWSGSTTSVFSGTSRSAQNAYSAQSAYSAQIAGSADSAEYFGSKLPSAYMQVANIGRDANGNISSYGGSAIAGLGDYVPKSATDCPIGSNNTAVNIAFAQGTTNSADTTAFAQGDANKSSFESFAQGKANTAANYSLAQGWQSSAERHSMTQGVSNTAYNLSFAQGDLNFADGLSLAQGEETLARWGSIAQGSGTSATNRSQAFGEGTVASASGMAIGTYNKTYDAAFVIGNGTKTNQSTDRSDLLVIDHSGNMVITAIYPSKYCSATYSPSGIHLDDSVPNGYDVYLTNEGVITTGYDGSTTIPMSARWLDIIDPRKNYVSAMGELPIVISAVTNLPPTLQEGIYYLV